MAVNKSIYKYIIENTISFTAPAGLKPLQVGIQNNIIYLWAVVTDLTENPKMSTYLIKEFTTGQTFNEFDILDFTFVGTACREIKNNLLLNYYVTHYFIKEVDFSKS